MKKTFTLALVLIMVSGVALSAWAAEDKVKLTFVIRDVREVYKTIVDEFNKTHDDIEVELLMFPTDQYVNKMLAMFSGGVGPDVFWVFEGDILKWASMGLMANLDEFLARDEELNRAAIYEATFDAMTYKGSVYGISEYVNPNGVIWYSKTMFDEAGLPTPHDYIKSGDWTMDTMRQAARKLSRMNPDDSQRTLGLNIPNWWGPMLSFLMTNGFSVTNDKGELDIHSEANIEAVEYLRQWVVEDRSTNAHEWPNEAELIKEKRLAMVVSGGWFTYAMDLVKPVELDVAIMPEGISGGRAAVISNPAIAMSAECKNREAAWEFMKYILVGEGARIRALEESDLPSAKELGHLVRAPQEIADHWSEAMIQSMGWAQPTPNALTARDNAMNMLLYGDQSLEAVWRGQADPGSILSGLQQRISAAKLLF